MNAPDYEERFPDRYYRSTRKIIVECDCTFALNVWLLSSVMIDPSWDKRDLSISITTQINRKEGRCDSLALKPATDMSMPLKYSRTRSVD